MRILGLEGRPGQASHQGTIPDSAPFEPRRLFASSLYPRTLGHADLRSSMSPSWSGAPPPSWLHPGRPPSSPPTRTFPAHTHSEQLRFWRRLQSGPRGWPLTREAWPRCPAGPVSVGATSCRVLQATACRRRQLPGLEGQEWQYAGAGQERGRVQGAGPGEGLMGHAESGGGEVGAAGGAET